MKSRNWILAGLLFGVGCASAPKTRLTFHEQVSALLPDSRVRAVEVPKTNLRIPVSPYPSLTDRNVKSAELVQTAGGAAVLLQFDARGMWLLDEVTTRSRGQHLVIFLNDQPVAAWFVDQRLSKGQFLLEADLTDAEAQLVVDDLNKLAKKPR